MKISEEIQNRISYYNDKKDDLLRMQLDIDIPDVLIDNEISRINSILDELECTLAAARALENDTKR